MAIFNQKPTPDKPGTTPEANLSLIAQGMQVVGDVYAEGIMRVEGRIQGTVICKSRLVIGANGRVEGNIDAQNATIEGEVKGHVVVRDLLEIQAKGRIYGDVVCEKFTMQAGGLFTGTCKMGPEAREILSKGVPKIQMLPKNLNLETHTPLPENSNPHVEAPDTSKSAAKSK